MNYYDRLYKKILESMDYENMDDMFGIAVDLSNRLFEEMLHDLLDANKRSVITHKRLKEITNWSDGYIEELRQNKIKGYLNEYTDSHVYPVGTVYDLLMREFGDNMASAERTYTDPEIRKFKF